MLSACLLVLSLAYAEPPAPAVATPEPPVPEVAKTLDAAQEALAAIDVDALNALIAAEEAKAAPVVADQPEDSAVDESPLMVPVK